VASNGSNTTTEITIRFTEQQLELIKKLAEETGRSPPDAVAEAIREFVRKEGGRYSS
jgi:predicted transcriptional regulator